MGGLGTRNVCVHRLHSVPPCSPSFPVHCAPTTFRPPLFPVEEVSPFLHIPTHTVCCAQDRTFSPLPHLSPPAPDHRN